MTASLPDLDDYDPAVHRYRDSYVKARPAIFCSKNPGGKFVRPEVAGFPEEIDIKENVPVFKVDERVQAYEWTLQDASGAVVGTRTQPVQGDEPKGFTIARYDTATFSNLADGAYTVTLRIKRKTGEQFVETKQIRVDQRIVASIGDSYSSGEGMPDRPGAPEDFADDVDFWEWLIPGYNLYVLGREIVDWSWNKLKAASPTIARAGGFTIDMNPAPVWQEAKAHRSLNSPHAVAAKRLEDLDRGRSVKFIGLGRSGSTINAGLLGPRSGDGWIANKGQVRELADTIGRTRIDALIITIGGNDVGFETTLKSLVLEPSLALAQTQKKVRDAIAGLTAKFTALNAEIDSRLNVDRVYLVGYPTGVFQVDQGGVRKDRAGCGIFALGLAAEVEALDLTLAEAKAVRELGEDLNAKLREEADRLDWTFVGGVDAVVGGQGYCDDDTCFVSAEESLAAQGDTEGTLHPNGLGSFLIGGEIARVIALRWRLHELPAIDLDKIKLKMRRVNVAGRAGGGGVLQPAPRP